MNAPAQHPPAIRTTCPYCGVGCGIIAKPDMQGGAIIAGAPPFDDGVTIGAPWPIGAPPFEPAMPAGPTGIVVADPCDENASSRESDTSPPEHA